MVGILAMSTSLEGYNVQPCKKPRKEEDPPIKTIANYCSPTVKVFSPPRSNNIADYFKRTPTCEKERTPCANEESSHRHRTETIGSNQSPVTPVTGSSRATGKRSKRAKRINLSRRLSDLKPESKSDIASGDDEIELPDTESVCGNTGFMGSDTAALLAEICSKAEDLDENESETSTPNATMCKNVRRKARSYKDKNDCSKSRKRKHDRDEQVQPNVTLEKQENEALAEKLSIMSSTTLERKSTISDSSLEVNVDENDDVVTVSFEDFLRSQTAKDPDPTSDYTDLTQDCSITSDEHGGSVNSTGLENSETAQKLSLKTVTVHAQVHLSPPLHTSRLQQNKAQKIAAIFMKKKDCEVEKAIRPPTSEREKTDQVIQKRKSNVVISEEELELAVLDVENIEPVKQKCTVEERQQFMKAFKQPVEAAKSGERKSLGKQKDSNEKSTKEGAGDDGHCKTNVEGERASLEITNNEAGRVNNKEGKLVKPKRLKKVNKNTESNTAGLVSNNGGKAKKTKKANANLVAVTESPVGESSSSLRRSSRHQKSELSPVKGVPEAPEGPILISTPKVKTCRKDDHYKSEVITIASETESPIRMRFTRLSARRRGKPCSSEIDEFIPRSIKLTGSAKKIIKAKKLLEKAKAIQQSIAKTEAPRRRSCRWRTLSERKHASEDSIIVIDNTNKTPKDAHKMRKKTNLRSLNDVLGKNIQMIKLSNTPSEQIKGSGKRRKKNAPITITDDSSPEVSENSQDDEEFKAKREFLMSGLPDTLKRHIAKTTALMEAYSITSSSFQNVVHVQQRDGCLMWNLSMPSCPLLTKLRHVNITVADVTKLALSLGEFTCAGTQPTLQLDACSMNGRRPVFSAAVQNYLLEEIRSSNPQFPVRRFFKQFLKKQCDQHGLPETHTQGAPSLEKSNKITDGNEENITQVAVCDIAETENKTKRKRKASPDVTSKKRKPASKAGSQKEPCGSKPPPRDYEGDRAHGTRPQASTRGQLSRAARKNQKCAESEPPPDPDVVVIDEDQKTASPVATVSDLVGEDVLWTEKYHPQNSSELIGNSNAIKRLHSWLKEWKIRAEKEETRNQMQKTEKDKQDTWDHSDFHDESSDSEEEFLCNTVLITGPPGVGKTAAVYACAQELGFKVFEVNASCQRSGRQILAQLKEATQSHQVDQQGVNAHKPCFFSSYSGTKSPRKLNSPRKVVSSPRKPPVSPRGSGLRKGLAPKSLANFFKVPPKQKSDDKAKLQEVTKATTQIVADVKETESTVIRNKTPAVEKGQRTDESHRKTATSLILFEEVDVIFDDDFGFLSAIKTFMTTTKRPVILTTSDPTFGLMFDGTFEKINFKTPSIVNVASYLQVLCLANNLRTDIKDFATFLTTNNCDIRQSVLHLQFWVRSGGGSMKEKPLSICGNPENGTTRADGTKYLSNPNKGDVTELDVKELPQCNIGCAESLLGLKNIISHAEDLISFVKCKITQPEEWHKILQLLTEFQMKNIHLISSNLELLLPLPVRIQEPKNPCLTENAATIPLDLGKEGSVDGPLKVSVQTKRSRKLNVLLNDSDLFDCDSTSADGFLTLASASPGQNQHELKSDPEVADQEINQISPPAFERRKLTPAEQKSSKLVFRCLGSMAEFADSMSYLDCCTYAGNRDQAEFCKNADHHWTGSRLKNGLCDGLRVETRDWWSMQSCAEVKAVMEALAFQKCSSNIAKAMDTSLELCKVAGKDPTEELTLHVPKHRDDVSFGQSSTCTSITEKRLSVMKTVFSNKAFVYLGTRQANVTDYLPALRSICKLEKLKEQGKTKRRYLHYFDGIHLELPKATINSLAADFP